MTHMVNSSEKVMAIEGMKHAEKINFLGHKPRKALSPHQGQSQPFG